jgi:hypothetical protein
MVSVNGIYVKKGKAHTTHLFGIGDMRFAALTRLWAAL